MHKFLSGALPILAVISALLLGPAAAGAVTVDFDDLPGDGLIPDGYGGINWNGEWRYYDDPPGNLYAPHSGATRITTNGATPSTSFDFLTAVVFDGAWFNGLNFSGPVFFELFLDGSLVHTSASLLLPGINEADNIPDFLGSGYGGLVDRVAVRSSPTNGNYWTMDDLTYSVAAVPEPASLVLLASGLVGVVLLRRRVRRD